MSRDAGDEGPMRRALTLAERARGRTAPNPLVGCVLLRDGRIVGEGLHRVAGGPHAEVEALRAAGDAARGATAFVTLEPCNHVGRTPPCTEALLEAGVARVVVALRDPDPRVRGGGLERLREGGIEVRTGVLEDEARAQNEAYLTARTEGRPLVLHKAAMTLDGKIATGTGESKWITGESARARVQTWRDGFDAVAVGVGTVLADDPRLTTRTAEGRTPRKVVFDARARTPVDAALFDADSHGAPADVTVFVGRDAPCERADALRARGATVRALGDGACPDVRAGLQHLLDRGVLSVLLEGGGTLAWSFHEAGLVDRVAFFVAPLLLGGRGATPLGGEGVARLADGVRLEALTSEAVGADLLLTGRPVRDAGGRKEAA